MARTFSPLNELESFQLPNGLRVYLQPDRRHPLVSVQTWIRVGSMDESEEDAGLSHVLEHMLFKGTEHHRAADISRWIESVGGSLNAETSREHTHYYIDVPSKGAERAVSLMGELLCRATFDPVEWQRECPVILEEIKRRNDDPESVLWELLNQAVFDHPRLQRPVIGYPKTVQDVTRARLQTFYRDHYMAGQTVLVIVGDFDRRQMASWVKRAFAAMPEGSRERIMPGAGDVPSRTRSLRQPVKQSYVALAMSTPGGVHPDQETLDVLAAVLGEGRGSRLVHRLREARKLVWSISAANITHEGPGLFAVFADCEPARREQVIHEIQAMVKQLRQQTATDLELNRAKNMLQSSWLQSFETVHGRAAIIGSFAVESHLDRLDQYLPRILAVTTRMISELVERTITRPLSAAFVEPA